jgi:hypothetical protein
LDVVPGRRLFPGVESESFGKFAGQLFEIDHIASGIVDEEASGTSCVVVLEAEKTAPDSEGNEATVWRSVVPIAQQLFPAELFTLLEFDSNRAFRIKYGFEFVSKRLAPIEIVVVGLFPKLAVPADILPAKTRTSDDNFRFNLVEDFPFRRICVAALVAHDRFVHYEVRKLGRQFDIHLTCVFQRRRRIRGKRSRGDQESGY